MPKSVYRKSSILTSRVPQKIDNCVTKLTTSGRNVARKVSSLYRNCNSFPGTKDSLRNDSRRRSRSFLFTVMCHRHRNGKERGFELTHRPHHCVLVRRSTNWHGSWIASYIPILFPLPPIPVLNIVINSNDIQRKDLMPHNTWHNTWHAHSRIVYTDMILL